jgi:acetyl-CoA decarbonylase/synthase complex subunit gamma
MSDNVDAISKALEITAAGRPLVYAATAANYEAMTEVAKKFQVPLVVKGENLDQLAELVEKVVALGYKDLVIDSGSREVSQMLADLTQIRRKALKERFRPFGYPALAIASNDDLVKEAVDAGVYISKYAGIVVIKSADPAVTLPLVTLRLNIYTDPQKPIAVEAKIYEINNPGPDAPVFITTNFSLTYFCVAGDVESARVPAYVIPIDTDGISVLTAWAAGKYSPEKITEDLTALGLKDKINHNKIIIPGHVAVLSGKVQELSGFEVLVGPRESSGIPSFLKQRWNA